MAQYRILRLNQTREFKNSKGHFRLQVRTIGEGIDSYISLNIDRALTPTSFDGTEGVDWENVEEMKYIDGTGVFRIGVRTGFVWDESLTENEFSGIEDTDWINIMYES